MKQSNYILTIFICLFFALLSTTFSLVNAEGTIDVSIKLNVSFESQNVMKMAYVLDENDQRLYRDYWSYNERIKNFYIKNEMTEIPEYNYKFDVTEEQNGRVLAYLVTNKDNASYYDLYLQADGIIYPNENASFYFDRMKYLDKIDNLNGMDTSEVVNMQGMFQNAGYYSQIFTLDVSGFDTGKVTNMRGMFNKTGYSSTIIELDVSRFDTSNVTDMYALFQQAGYTNPNFTIDVSNFNTSKVTNMAGMFSQTGYNSRAIQLDVSNFNTEQVTNMQAMFQSAGKNNSNFTLNVSNFNTSNVTNMSYMFNMAGYNSTKFKLNISNLDTSHVTDMSYMFNGTGYSDPDFSLDISTFDTSQVTNMANMFKCTGGNSARLNTSITIRNPGMTTYGDMFKDVATKEGSKIKVNYTSETEELVDKMIATKSSDSNVVKGNLIIDVDKLTIGDEIHISGEKFNVISQTDDTVTMLAQYILGTDYRQSTTSNTVSFADKTGWEYTPGPKEIDIQTWSTNPKTYVNEYVDYLKEELGDDTVTGNLITLGELKGLGCTITDDYSYINGLTCANSSYKSWLVNGQKWWTRSAISISYLSVWSVNYDGILYRNSYNLDYGYGVRPVITISKETLRNLK